MQKGLPASVLTWSLLQCFFPEVSSQSQWAIETVQITGIAHGPAGFVAVGSPGAMGDPATIYHSKDGLEWVSFGRHESTRDVVSAFGAYFLPGWYGGKIRNSINGREWRGIESIGYNGGSLRVENGRLFSLGGSNTSVTEDANSWSNLMVSLRDLVFAQGRYVGLGEQSILVSTNLAQWTSTSIGTNDFHRIVFGNNRFVASSYGNILAHSDDGVEWTNVQVSTNSLSWLQFVGGRFFVTGRMGTILSSTDGREWRSENAPVEVTLGPVVYGAGRYVLGADRGTLMVSNGDGEWRVVRNAPLSGTDIISGHGWLAGIVESTKVVRSTNGNYWEEIAVANLGAFYGICVIPGGFLLVGERGQTALSTNLIDWTASRAPTTNALVSACFGNGTYVAVGENGTVVSSRDAVDWRLRTLGRVTLNAVAYGNEMFVAVGTGAAIISSPDGITWTLRSSGNVRLQGLAFGNGIFVAAGTHAGTVMTSKDGIQWEYRTRGSQFQGVTFTGREFVAGGDFGNLSYSRNGIDWHSVHATRGNTFAIAYQNGVFYGFSSIGLISARRDLELGSPLFSDGAWRLPILGLSANAARVLGSTDFALWKEVAAVKGTGEEEIHAVVFPETNRRFFKLQVIEEKEEGL